MIKKWTFLLLVFSITIVSGCKKYLDIQPKGSVIPTTTADYEGILNDFYDITVNDECFGTNFFSDDAYVPDEELGSSWIFSSLKNVNAYKWQDMFPTTSGESDVLWETSYLRIYRYNVIIDNVMSSTGGSETDKKAIRAEALVGRAIDYFSLVNTYGGAYGPETRSSLAVPLVLKADINSVPIKNTVEEIYSRIISDLKDAAVALPVAPKGNKVRASKFAALSLLARIGLYTGNYAMAKAYADTVLRRQNILLNYDSFPRWDHTATSTSPLPYAAKDNPEIFYARYYPYYNMTSLSGLVWASDDLYSLYEPGDLRKDYWFSEYVSQTDYYNAPFNYHHYAFVANIEISVAPGVPEILLTRAEACMRLGGGANKTQALDDLNALRQHRFEASFYQPLTPVDDESLLRKVLDERRRELPFRSIRFYDLKRLNSEPRFAKTLTRTVNGVTLTLPPNSPQYKFKVAQKLIQINPNLGKY